MASHTPWGAASAERDHTTKSGREAKTDIAPKEARATKAVLTERGELRLQFNNAFDRTYGSEEERALVDGILHSLGQFKEIVNVQFCIGDQPMETLGHIDLSTPQAVLRDGS